MEDFDLKKYLTENKLTEMTKREKSIMNPLKKFKTSGRKITDKEQQLIDEVETNLDNWRWLQGVFVEFGNIFLAVGYRLSPNELLEIMELMKKYRMNLDAPDDYTRRHGYDSMVLRLYYN